MKILGKEWRSDREVLLADGAWGTEFLKRGLKHGDPPEEWNLSNRSAVLEVARAYREAGSLIILTNSFGGSRFQLERHGLTGKTREINRLAAELTKEACAGKALVAGDIGPSGKLYIMGEVSEEELYAAFLEQAEALKEGGADLIVAETMIDMGEMEIAVRAAASLDLPVVASVTYEKGAAGYRTVMGHSPEDCVLAAAKAGAALIGANCGAGVDTYVELASELRKLTPLPLWIKANAGLPELVDGKTVYRMNPEVYASFIPRLLEAGVNVVGGCCGTSPEFIKRIKVEVDRWNAR